MARTKYVKPKQKYKPEAQITRKRGQTMVSKIQSVVNSALHRTMETKRSCFTASDGSQIGHNNFIVLDSNVLETSNGTGDPTTTQTNNRIGDEIMLRGVSIKMMVELNERYSDVTFRMFVVRKAKGDTLNTGTFFNGLSGNKMIDTINTERYTILYSKTFKLTARAQGTVGGETGGIQSGINLAHGDSHTVLSRATKIVKFYIPGKKFGRRGKITYENSGTQTKFFDYQVLLYAYSNYSTSDTLGYNVGRLNDYVRQLYYKDS